MVVVVVVVVELVAGGGGGGREGRSFVGAAAAATAQAERWPSSGRARVWARRLAFAAESVVRAESYRCCLGVRDARRPAVPGVGDENTL